VSDNVEKRFETNIYICLFIYIVFMCVRIILLKTLINSPISIEELLPETEVLCVWQELDSRGFNQHPYDTLPVY